MLPLLIRCPPTQAEAMTTLDPPTIASHTLLTLATTSPNLFKAVKTAAPNGIRKASTTAIVEKRVKDGNTGENGDKLEKLNQRAEQFIG